MGNFWIAQFDSSSSSSPSSTRPSSPGITKSTSNEGTHSGTGSAFSSRLDEVSPNGQILPITPTLKIFSFAELKKATSKFSPDTFLGEGAFGKVFKGWIDEKTFAPTKAGRGMAIAVKKLHSDDFQGHEEWQSEVNILGSLSHPNIVRLLGFCREDRERLLVYEFMPRGSLSNHLFSRGSAFQSLSWSIRLKIAIGAARAIAFLHCSERKIISRDVKPSNILLDSDYDAKIYNFGLAKNGPVGENSHVSTRVMGTYGYAAPEYVATAISRNNSNEGTHSGSTSAFSSSMNEVSPKFFSFAELKKATRKFSRDTFLGEGGFGQVFKGWIDEKTLAQTKAGSGMAIAVKKMNSESLQGREEWQSEVNFLGSFSHPNLVRLLGHCEEDKELLLVYEFMPGGSLENHLFRISGAFPGGSFSSKLCETFGMLLGRQRITTCIMPRGDLESHLFRSKQ